MTIYVEGAELAEYLKASGVSTNDSFLSIAAESTSRAIDDYCGRRFYPDGSATARVFRAANPHLLHLHGNDFWTTDGLVVQTDEGDDGTFETTWASTDYELRPLNGLRRGTTWPYDSIRAVEARWWPTLSKRAGVQITAKWGWAEVPAKVTQAALIKAARLFLRKQSPTGVQDGGMEFGPIRITRASDPDVAEMLDDYRLGREASPVAT